MLNSLVNKIENNKYIAYPLHWSVLITHKKSNVERNVVWQELAYISAFTSLENIRET